MKAQWIDRIEGVLLTDLNLFKDSRGSFVKFELPPRLSSEMRYTALSLNPNPGTIRGLHFQVEPFAEEKLVSCLHGAIFDVIVDLRPNSTSFCRWTSIELNLEKSLQVYLPKGVAHGFQTLVPNSIVHYSLSASYSPTHSYSINPFGELEIDWPLNTNTISENDANGIELSVATHIYAESITR